MASDPHDIQWVLVAIRECLPVSTPINILKSEFGVVQLGNAEGVAEAGMQRLSDPGILSYSGQAQEFANPVHGLLDLFDGVGV